MKKFHIKKGDTVYVNAGNDKGTTGKVLSVLRDKDRVIVEGVNMVSKHTKPNAKQPQGGIIEPIMPPGSPQVSRSDDMTLLPGLMK